MAQDPWSNDPIVNLRDAPPVADAPRPYKVVRRTSTSETPTQLLNQGYRQEADGTWAKVVGTEPMPWEADPVVTDSQLAAQTRAAEIVGTNNTDNRENALMQGVTFGLADEIGGNFAGWGQQLRNIGRNLNGQPIEIRGADLRDAVIEQTRGRNADFRETNPFQSGAFEFAGGALTGGGGVGTGLRGLATTGALYGGGYGLGTGEGDLIDRAPGGVIGAAGGAAFGLGGGVAVRAAAPYAQRLGSIAGGLVPQPVREFAGRIGTSRPEPGVVAARRITDQVRRGNVDPTGRAQQMRAAGLSPSVLDVGGENLAATVRASASAEGPARQMAVEYRNRVASELTPRVVERTRRLTGSEPRDSITMAGDITRSRGAQARTDYAPAYETEIVVPDAAIRALRGDEGSQAMQQARRIASVEQDYQTMEEIDRLITADLDAAPVASGRALEYVRRAYRDLAVEAAPELAVGLETRMRQLDGALDEIPELRAARRAYYESSSQIDALGGSPDPRTGRQVLGRPDRSPVRALDAPSPLYEAYTGGLPEGAALPNQVYQRDQLINRLATGPEGAVGTINRITPGAGQPITPNSAYVARNLETTFPGQGQQYQQDLALARDQMSLANRVNPNDGSQTATRQADSAMEGIGNAVQTGAALATGGKSAAISLAISNMIRRAGLNEQERAAVVQLGLGSADDVERIFAIADASRQRGRPPPREVRAWVTNATNVLGAQSPIARELRAALLPTRAAATEDRQGSER